MLYPLNKYLVVEPIEHDKPEATVILPDDFNLNEEKFKLVKVIEPNIDSRLMSGMRVVVPSHMIEEASFFGKTYYLVTENHVVGFYEEK
tara:strand:+ start:893 stop:1159 length:267 start_codon:yes stop_codon:yes gene_type:complete